MGGGTTGHFRQFRPLTIIPMTGSRPCFFERDSSYPLRRRAGAEALGTLLLAFIAAGSTLWAEHLFGRQSPAVLLVGAAAPAAALAALVLTFGFVSGGHFNPLITALQWMAGERSLDCTLAYVGAQVAGAILGVWVVDLLFGPMVLSPSSTAMSWPLCFSETAATAGLMIIVFGCARGGHAETGGFAVGLWLAAAILTTPSGSYANPALTLGAIFTSGPVALPPWKAAGYIGAQIVGALVAFGLIRMVFPTPNSARERSRDSIPSPPMP
jgi:glycerol uptake facilitator-like aquaporin